MDLSWYMTLVKPAWNPPNWLFGPVWTVLYILMGVALVLVLREKGVAKQLRQRALVSFSGQLALNLVWSPIFFTFQKPGVALLDLIVMWCTIFVTMQAFRKISKTAFWLMVPYIVWVTFAGYLNLSIWLLNK